MTSPAARAPAVSWPANAPADCGAGAALPTVADRSGRFLRRSGFRDDRSQRSRIADSQHGCHPAPIAGRGCTTGKRPRCAPGGKACNPVARTPTIPPCPASIPVLPLASRLSSGPTNTGKTHLAIERLLAHSSGIIGFPLRLLARENYDSMVARKGARHVALITGRGEDRPPRRPLVLLHRRSHATRPRRRVRRGGRDPALRRPRPGPRLHRPPAARSRHG